MNNMIPPVKQNLLGLFNQASICNISSIFMSCNVQNDFYFQLTYTKNIWKTEQGIAYTQKNLKLASFREISILGGLQERHRLIDNGGKVVYCDMVLHNCR